MSADVSNNAIEIEKPSSTLADSQWMEVFRHLLGNKTATAGLVIFIVVCLACIFAPVITRHNYHSANFNRSLETPSLEHIFGTDRIGRDVFARILYGGRTTLRIAFVSTTLAAVVGSTIGLLIGYFGGRVDFYASHLLDILGAIPIFLLIVIVEVALGWGKGYFMYAMAIAAVPQFARLVRASVMNIMGNEYIEAARALGVSHLGIIRSHILHNAAPPLIIRYASGVSDALLLCTIMGYIGIGINPPTPEWGLLAFQGSGLIRSHPRLMIIPCAAIIITVISISLFSDGLRDALDPKESS